MKEYAIDYYKELFADFTWQTWLALAVFVISLVICFAYRLTHDVKFRGDKRIEKAKSMGHMVSAKCIRCHSRTSKRNGSRYRTGRYAYEVDGKRYERVISWNDHVGIHVGDTTTLYWIDNPKWTFVAERAGGVIEIVQRLGVIIIPLLLMVFTLYITDGFR